MSRCSDDERRWMEQWRYAAAALEDMRREELRTLTDHEARVILRRLLSGPAPRSPRRGLSGLVEQQRLFHVKSA
ncbi:MAG: hypothetical protein ACRD0K_08465 [Egibacteraceae bacterium]